MSRPLSDTDLAALKSATKDLVQAVGGLARAAALTGYSDSQISRWYQMRDGRDPDVLSRTIIDLASVACLERELAELDDPRRPVTACLARLNGRELTDAPATRACARVAAAAAEFTEAVHGVIENVMVALSDGKVTPAEALGTDDKAAKAERALLGLRSSLSAAKIGGAR